MADEYEIGPIGPDETDAYLRAAADAFLDDVHEEDFGLWRRLVEHERTLVARHEGAIVANSGLLTMRLAVPGGVVPMAGVTAVGVDPVHRGRGLLDRMMRGHLTAIRERGAEAVSALWASEAGIYGRWGFGPAAQTADLTVRSPDARLLRPAPRDRLRHGEPSALLPELRATYDALYAERPGLLARDELRWAEALHDPEHAREGATKMRALAIDGGYALYAVRDRQKEGRPDAVIELYELLAATPEVAAALWHHLLTLSLTRSIHWATAPPDEPLVHMLTDSRAVRARLDDGLFVRLVDVPRALAERRYGAPVDVVLEVADPVCPWNEGRWRLAADGDGAICERTAAGADLALGATELGAAYLGGTPLALLAAAGRVEERTPGALAAASHAFRGTREPWCAEVF